MQSAKSQVFYKMLPKTNIPKIKEFWRVLRPKGRMFMYVHCCNNYMSIQERRALGSFSIEIYFVIYFITFQNITKSKRIEKYFLPNWLAKKISKSCPCPCITCLIFSRVFPTVQVHPNLSNHPFYHKDSFINLV